MAFNNRQKYYDAIAQSAINADSGVFIDFMLNEIYITLEEHRTVTSNVGTNEIKALEMIKLNRYINSKEIAENLNISLRQTERIMALLKTKGLITRVGSNKPEYWQTNIP
ncbi:MAG: Rrf2 family transcriptional regulator [Muribaculaceae bacterium]|nr:Rrf2 family transcriptional regulator [Muribaculaceae bacterium]